MKVSEQRAGIEQLLGETPDIDNIAIEKYFTEAIMEVFDDLLLMLVLTRLGIYR